VDQEPIEPVEAPDVDAHEPAPEHASEADAAPAPTPQSEPGTPELARAGTRRLIIEVVQTLVLTLVIFLVIQNFVAQPFQVQQHSMETTFSEGDYVLVDRLTPRWSPYQRGQVVVFQAPEGWSPHAEPFIKRVIGVAGDTVEVRDDGTVAVNGAVLDEPYLFRDESGAVEPTFADAEARWVIPDGQLFVMGDHRQASEDSRVFGPIEVSSVIGRGMFSYWPLSDVGIVATPTYDNVPAP
jgi:signal peptidase I